MIKWLYSLTLNSLLLRAAWSLLCVTYILSPGDSWIIWRGLCKAFIWEEHGWMCVLPLNPPPQAQGKELRCMWIWCVFCSFPFETLCLFSIFMVLSLLIAFSACFKDIMMSTNPVFYSYFLQSQTAAASATEQGCLALNPGSLLLKCLCWTSFASSVLWG